MANDGALIHYSSVDILRMRGSLVAQPHVKGSCMRYKWNVTFLTWPYSNFFAFENH